jgi:hypothetical protein
VKPVFPVSPVAPEITIISQSADDPGVELLNSATLIYVVPSYVTTSFIV